MRHPNTDRVDRIDRVDRSEPGWFTEYGRFRLGAAMAAGGGVFVAARSMSAWEPIGVFIGLLTVGLALGATSFFRILEEQLDVLRVSRRAFWQSQVSVAALESLMRRIEQVELCRASVAPGGRSTVPSATALSMATVDLTQVGDGNMDLLTAATLDRSIFPRLATAMPDEGHGVAREHALPRAGEGSEKGSRHARDSADVALCEGVDSRNIFREWQQAVERHDLGRCRRIHATLTETLLPETLAPLTRQLSMVAAQVEGGLRKQFVEAVHRRDYHGALAIGAEMCALLPDRPVAAEFLRIRQQLARCAV